MLEENYPEPDSEKLNGNFRVPFINGINHFLRDIPENNFGIKQAIKDLDVDIWYGLVENSLKPLYQGHTEHGSDFEIPVFKPDKMSLKASVESDRKDDISELWLNLGYIIRGTEETADFLCLYLDVRSPAHATSFVYSEEIKDEAYIGHDFRSLILSGEQLEDLYFILSQAEATPHF